MRNANPFFGLFTLLTFITAAEAGSVSSTRQSCIISAIEAGSAAISNPAQLKALYERYFVGEKIAQLAAGNYWDQYDDAKKMLSVTESNMWSCRDSRRASPSTGHRRSGSSVRAARW
jgi:hypothetical protein